MRAAPLKGDCKICQAPEPTRVAINVAIWPGEGIVRAVDYRIAAVRVAQDSGVPAMASLDPKTVTKHAEHTEASWREITPGSAWRDGEEPVSATFADVMDTNARVGMKATRLIEKLLDEHGEVISVFKPGFVLDVAAKLGMRASEAREKSRLTRNRQAIDVVAIFGLSAGFLTPPRSDDEQEVDVADLRRELEAERKLLTART